MPRRSSRTPGWQLGEPLDVGLVDDRLGPGHRRRTVVLPVERPVDHHRAGHRRRGVLVVDLEVGVGPTGHVGERARRIPVDLAVDRLRVRVDQQLGRVEPQPVAWLVRSVDPVAVAGARTDVGDEAVPVVRGVSQHGGGRGGRRPGQGVAQARSDFARFVAQGAARPRGDGRPHRGGGHFGRRFIGRAGHRPRHHQRRSRPGRQERRPRDERQGRRRQEHRRRQPRARAAAHRATRVGLLDADIYGPSIPTMLGVIGQPAQPTASRSCRSSASASS